MENRTIDIVLGVPISQRRPNMFRADAIYEEIYGLNDSLNRCPARSRGRIHRQMAKLVAEYESLTGCTWKW